MSTVPPTTPVHRAIVVAMLHDLVTALLVAFAEVTAPSYSAGYGDTSERLTMPTRQDARRWSARLTPLQLSQP